MIGSFRDMIDNYDSFVCDYTNNGECSNCGQCCSDLLPISDAEIARIRRYVREYGIKAQKNIVANAEFDMTCPFRNEVQRKCLIYDVRPEICKTFMCCYKKADIDRNKKLFHQKNKAVSMRDVFFGDTSNTDIFNAFIMTMISRGGFDGSKDKD